MTASAIVVFAGALLLVTSRTAIAVGAYVVLAIAAGVLILPAAAASLLAIGVLSLTIVMKVVVVPLAIGLFVRAHPAARTLRPVLAAPLRMLLAAAFVGLASAAAGFPDGAAPPGLAAGLFVVACSIGMLIVHRNLIAHLIGLLAFGTGVTFCGAVLAAALPESLELGATFDALVGTFIGLTLMRAFAAHDPLLDVESLRHLRG